MGCLLSLRLRDRYGWYVGRDAHDQALGCVVSDTRWFLSKRGGEALDDCL